LYKYKLWGTKIVVEYTSEKRDKTKDYTYRNNFGKMEENHMLNLYLVDPHNPDEITQELVGYSDFGNNHQYSEFYPAKRKETKNSITGAQNTLYDKETFTQWKEPKQETYYIFEINGKEIAVAERILN
jgi:hypothetical protein